MSTANVKKSQEYTQNLLSKFEPTKSGKYKRFWGLGPNPSCRMWTLFVITALAERLPWFQLLICIPFVIIGL